MDLQERISTCKYGKNFPGDADLKRKQISHDFGGCSAELGGELSKIVQVGLVQGVPHDLNVHLVQVICRRKLILLSLREGKTQCSH